MDDPMTCIHRDKGLCPACQSDHDADPQAWLEFGQHPAGVRNWERLQAEMLDGLPEEPADPKAKPGA